MNNRVIFIDYLRAIACFMVMICHSCEPFYLGGQGTFVDNAENGLLVTLIDSLMRPAVPLFVLASSYLLFPIQGEVNTFYRKRALRIIPPFILWSLFYALMPMYGNLYDFYKADNLIANVQQLAFNFVGAAGHLWFVYMLLGVYLVMPIFSPWIEKVSKCGEQWFLCLWILTTFVPFWRYAALQFSGLAEIFGEANWNEFGTFYYVSGFIGYVILGHYIRIYCENLSWKLTLVVALPCLIVGYAITAYGFWNAMPKDFPFDGPIDVAVRMELTWGFCTFCVTLQTIGIFLLIKKITATGWLYYHFILPVSNVSYGMYLIHISFLCFFTAYFQENLQSTFNIILLTAVSTFICSFVLAYFFRKIPVIGKYMV